MSYKGKVLTIAGSDSSGGAGIQADIKTITMLGCYAASCITSITVQDTTEVYCIQDLSLRIIKDQILVVLNDIGIDAIKIGMLSNIEIVKLVSSVLPVNIPVIFDPVMVATTGFNLVEKNIVSVFKEYIMPKSLIVTPNVPEAIALTGLNIEDVKGMEEAGKIILSYGPQAVLIKGGHLKQDIIPNILLTKENKFYFSHKRIIKDSLHGTGCTLSSAIASFITHNDKLDKAVDKAIKYVYNVIENSPKIGKGCSSICHNYFLL